MHVTLNITSHQCTDLMVMCEEKIDKMVQLNTPASLLKAKKLGFLLRYLRKELEVSKFRYKLHA